TIHYRTRPSVVNCPRFDGPDSSTMRTFTHYILLLLLAVTILVEAIPLPTGSRRTEMENTASVNANSLNNAVSVRSSGERLLRTHRTDSEGNSNNTDQEEREIQNTVTAATAKIIANLGTKWKTLTNDDFRNMKLFLKAVSKDADDTAYDMLFRKGATPYKLFTEMRHNGIDTEAAINAKIKALWAGYFTYWVKRNAGEIKGVK
ncbi:hypothetical protein L914_16326, partial [Phytophthora nicotianae]